MSIRVQRTEDQSTGGSLARFKSQQPLITRRFIHHGALDRFKSTECRGQVSKQFVVTGSSQQSAEDR